MGAGADDSAVVADQGDVVAGAGLVTDAVEARGHIEEGTFVASGEGAGDGVETIVFDEEDGLAESHTGGRGHLKVGAAEVDGAGDLDLVVLGGRGGAGCVDVGMADGGVRGSDRWAIGGRRWNRRRG